MSYNVPGRADLQGEDGEMKNKKCKVQSEKWGQA